MSASTQTSLRIPATDPLAWEIMTARPDGRIYTSVHGKLFLLRSWQLEWDNGEKHLTTQWDTVDDLVKRWTIPLRVTIRMRAMYWRQKLFGRHTPAR